MNRQGRVRSFHRSRQRELHAFAKGLRNTQCLLPSPIEPYRVLRVDRHRQRFGAVVRSLLRFGNQAPHLAAGDLEAVVPMRLSPSLTNSQDVAVALVVVRTDTRAEEVGLDVAAQLDVSQLAFRQHAQTRLTCARVPLCRLSARISRERNAVQRRVNVAARRLVAEHGFSRQEPARGDRDALEANRNRIVRTRRLTVRGADDPISKCPARRSSSGRRIDRSAGGLQLFFHHFHFLLLRFHQIVLHLNLAGLRCQQFANLLQFAFDRRGARRRRSSGGRGCSRCCARRLRVACFVGFVRASRFRRVFVVISRPTRAGHDRSHDQPKGQQRCC